MDVLARHRGVPDPVDLSPTRVIEQVRDLAMFLVDRQGRVASWNEGVGLILGWNQNDWIGQPVRVVFTPEDVQAGVPESELLRAAAVGRADDDRWMQRRNGERFFALGMVTRLLDAHGTLAGYLKVLRDHTGPAAAAQERERLLASEQAARARAENHAAALSAAIGAITGGVWIADAAGVQRCNAAALQLFGASSVAELRVEPQALIERFRIRRERAGPLLAAAELPHVLALQGQATVLEMWATHAASGADLSLHCAAAPIGVDGQVIGAVAVYSDLTERLQLHEKGRDLSRVQTVLHERDAELRALLDGVRDYAIYMLGTDGRISSWHAGAERLKGYSAAEAIGKPYAELFTPEDRDAGRPALEMALAARDGEYKGDGLRLRKDGSRFEAEVVLTALRGPQGELLGYIKLTQDISRRKQMERQREEMLRDAQAARADAERASHSKDEFLATISHELRTPLAAIQGWAQVLERGVCDTETVRQGLAAISRNARIQVQLIEDLLDMNRIESGQLRLDLQRIELGGVIAAAIDSALPAATAKGIGMRTVFSPASGTVMGDAARLQQVVANLLNNAIKFTPTGGRIEVALGQSGAWARISISDTGQGIEPAFLARVFDRFQQQDATTTRRHGGLGIGLAIVAHLVKLHGGTVQAHSPGAGQGATFTVTLPANENPALQGAAGPAVDPAPPEANPATAARLDGVTVLLVEDDADVRVITARVLHEAGARVVEAADAEDGLALLRREQPALLLCDIGMPRVDGHELIRRVRTMPDAEGGATPAVAFTAYTRPEDRQRALDAGYQMHLAKPVPPGTLVAALAKLLATRSAGGFGSSSARLSQP